MGDSSFIFPQPPSYGTYNINVDLSNYATKSEMKAITGVDTSIFVKSTEFLKIKGDVDKIKEDDKKHLDEFKKLKDNVANTSAGDLTKLKNDLDKIKEDDKKHVAQFTALKGDVHRAKDDINKIKEDDKKQLDTFVKKTDYTAHKDGFILKKTYLKDMENMLKNNTITKKYIDDKLKDIDDKIKNISVKGTDDLDKISKEYAKKSELSTLATKAELTTQINTVKGLIPDSTKFVDKKDFDAMKDDLKNNYATKTDLGKVEDKIKKADILRG